MYVVISNKSRLKRDSNTFFSPFGSGEGDQRARELQTFHPIPADKGWASWFPLVNRGAPARCQVKARAEQSNVQSWASRRAGCDSPRVGPELPFRPVARRGAIQRRGWAYLQGLRPGGNAPPPRPGPRVREGQNVGTGAGTEGLRAGEYGWGGLGGSLRQDPTPPAAPRRSAAAPSSSRSTRARLASTAVGRRCTGPRHRHSGFLSWGWSLESLN